MVLGQPYTTRRIVRSFVLGCLRGARCQLPRIMSNNGNYDDRIVGLEVGEGGKWAV